MWQNDSSAQRRNMEELLREHPLYGRVLESAELPSLLEILAQAWTLPVSHEFRIAYLINGEEECSDAESVMSTNHSDVFLLTFKTRRWDALFFPRSTYSEGRNMLLVAAAYMEIRRGHRYSYYSFMDADSEPALPWHIWVPRFERLLIHWAPAVGMPAIDVIPPSGMPAMHALSKLYAHDKGARGLNANKKLGVGSASTDVFNFDHTFIAIHAEAAASLLPYNSSLDKTCWWVSPWLMTLLANALFKNHVLLFPAVRIRNTVHGAYSKNDCVRQMSAVSAWLRASAPFDAQNCFLDAQHGQYFATLVRRVKRFVSDGAVAHQPNYALPWGVPHRKGRYPSAPSYSSASLTTLSPCDDEEPVRSLNRPSSAFWCMGCAASEALVMLQAIVAVHVYRASGWNELGVWFSQTGKYVLSAASFHLGRRLLSCQARFAELAAIDDNLASLERLAMAGGVGLPHLSQFWKGGSLGVTAIVDSVLQSEDLPGHKFLAGEALHRFVEFLISCAMPCETTGRIVESILAPV